MAAFPIHHNDTPSDRNGSACMPFYHAQPGESKKHWLLHELR